MNTREGLSLRIAVGIVAVSAAAVIGALIARNSIYTEANVRSFVHNGVWYTDKGFGNVDATPVTRAYVAIVGLMALARSETVYYMAHTDEDGDPISSENKYEITGVNLPSRWFSITLYDSDHFLTPNSAGKYSVKGTDVEYEDSGMFRVILSRDQVEGNWIPMGQGENMSLLLRLYNPDPNVLTSLDKIELPKIRKVAN